MADILSTFLTGLAGASSLFLIASGLTLIFGVTRIINLAHGSLYMLGAYLFFTLTQFSAGSVFGYWISLLLAAVGVAVVGLLLEISILRRIYKVPEVFQLLATFGIVLLFRDIIRAIWGPQHLMVPRVPGFSGGIEILGTQFPEYGLFVIATGALILGLLLLVVHRTRWGVLVRAATQDREMVGALGGNEKLLFSSVFFAGSFLAGLGGALEATRQSVNLHMDFSILIVAFIVVIVGGMGSIVGAYIVAIVLGQLQAFGTLLIPDIAMVLPFLLMAIALVVRPAGLFGRGEYVMRTPVGGPEPPRAPAEPMLKWLILLGAAILLFMPVLFDDYALAVAIEVIIFALFAASLHFIMAGGLLSFGHAAYFGLGAYAAAMLTKHLGAPMVPALLAAPVVAGIGGLAFGWFFTRLSGVYQGMLSLAFAQLSWAVVFQWYDFTGGDNGTLGIWPSDWASTRVHFYYLALVVCASSIGALFWLLGTPFGQALRATRDSRQRAEAVGINVGFTHWMAFALAGAFAGVAGGVYVFSKGSIFPNAIDLPNSLNALVIILLGGVNTLVGPLVGSVIFKVLEQQLTSLTDYWRLVLGAVVVFLVVVFPEGVVGFAKSRLDRLRPRRRRV